VVDPSERSLVELLQKSVLQVNEQLGVVLPQESLVSYTCPQPLVYIGPLGLALTVFVQRVHPETATAAVMALEEGAIKYSPQPLSSG